MAEPSDTDLCKETIFRYCTAMNKWEQLRYIPGRIERGQFVTAAQTESVKMVTQEAHDRAHAKIFDPFIVPRARKYGSNPGRANSWGKNGSYFDVNPGTIRSVEFPAQNRAEIIADRGTGLPGGTTMFILKRVEGKWLIDSLKVRFKNDWKVACL